MDPRSNHNYAAFVPAIRVVALPAAQQPQQPQQAPPPPQPLPQMAVLPPQVAPAIVRPPLGVTPSPYGKNILTRSRLQKSPYSAVPFAPAPPPPPPPPAPGPVVRPVVAASASTIQGNGMPQQYMQPAPFYFPAHARHRHHAAIRGELSARVAFRRSMDAADRVFGQTTREAHEAMDRALSRQ